jgi:hypothetical protein
VIGTVNACSKISLTIPKGTAFSLEIPSTGPQQPRCVIILCISDKQLKIGCIKKNMQVIKEYVDASNPRASQMLGNTCGDPKIIIFPEKSSFSMLISCGTFQDKMSDDEAQHQSQSPSEPSEGKEKDNLWKRTYNFSDEQLAGRTVFQLDFLVLYVMQDHATVSVEQVIHARIIDGYSNISNRFVNTPLSVLNLQL